MKNVIVIGSGARQRGIAEFLGKTENVMHFASTVPKDALELCDAVILPMPATDDGIFVSGSETKIEEIFGYGDKTYIGGRISDAFSAYRKKHTIIDYTKAEDFAIKNAVPTAEAAVCIAAENTPFTIHGSTCIITGYGKIAKVLARILKSMNARVVCCIRNTTQAAAAFADGFEVIDYSHILGFKCNIIFNTVPAMVITEKVLLYSDAHLVVDLASSPGGTDFDAAKRLNINAIHALSLPGKTSPQTAAEITAATIKTLL